MKILRCWLIPVLLLLSASSLKAADADPELQVDLVTLGDAGAGVVVRIDLHYSLPPDVLRAGAFVQGSILSNSTVLRNFRRQIHPDEARDLSITETVPPGKIQVETRLLAEQDSGVPLLISKVIREFRVGPVGTPFTAGDDAGAEEILAEGVPEESAGAVTIQPPRRDVAPNLFIVDVEVKPPAERLEFWVEGKKIMTRNRPPYRAELDLGNLPRRIEVKVVGYDRSGRYVDADSWIVNERETPLEIAIARTVTDDGMNHFKLTVQNPKGAKLQSVALFAGDRKLHEWSMPPYALAVPGAQLQGIDFVRATAVGSDGYEASDLVYLDGERYTERIDVNLVELPVSVTDDRGAPQVDLKKEQFQVLEEGQPKSISSFSFSADLPLSVGVLVDHSGSMTERIDQARQAALDFFGQILRPEDRAFFGGFSWETTSLSPFVSDLSSLASQVDQMPAPEGGTALYDAIVTALYRFRSVSGRKALVIVTDGDDTVSRIPYDEMLEYVRASRVPIYFVGIGISMLDFTASSKLKTLAAETGGVAYFVKRVDGLKETYAQIDRELRTQYLIGYYTESSGKDHEYRTVEVKVNLPNAKVRTIRGFIP